MAELAQGLGFDLADAFASDLEGLANLFEGVFGAVFEAEALLGENRPPEEDEVASALQEVQERAMEGRLRDLRAQIAEAERRGDYAELAVLSLIHISRA